MTDSINKVMQKHLLQLKQEINSYPNERDLWQLSGEISNTAGNLCLHLCGNLQHFIGAILGNSGYIRQREAEFAKKDVPVAELQKLIDTTANIISVTLQSLDEESLSKTYPVQVFNQPMTTEFFLIHLTGHLSYHLGQINYHRRILAMN
jgi:uncharacterized damage-inducible protein DinB